MTCRRALIPLVLLAGCGGGGDDDGGGDDRGQAGRERAVPADAVALVDDEPVSREDFEHWLEVAAAQHNPTSERRTPEPGDAGYERLRDQTITFLVSAAWIDEEAEAQGLQVTDDEIRRSFERQKDESFPSESEYRGFLEMSAQTEEDVLFRVRLQLLAQEISDAAGEASGEGQEAIDKFAADFRHKYRARTLCAEGFETADCSNGPEPPAGG